MIVNEARAQSPAEGIQYLRQLVEAAQAKYRAGIIPKTDVDQAKGELDAAMRQP